MDRDSGWLCTTCLAQRRKTQQKKRKTIRSIKETADLIEIITERRQELNISQRQLADLTGIHSLPRLETHGIVPSFDMVLKIFAALKLEFIVKGRFK
jgi:ribosome-binding protein aMBF1 (putative translation factor)